MWIRILLVLLACSTSWARASDLFESSDLSGDGLAPDSFLLQIGVNTWSGAVGFLPSGAIDRDYVAVTVPTGSQLDQIVLGPQTSVGGAYSFVGVQTGGQMTVSPTSGSAAGLLGWYHYGSGDVGQNILPAVGAGPGSSGFSGPLPSGTYTFWVQDFSAQTIPYQFNFVVSAVPDAPAALLLISGLLVPVARGVLRRGRSGPRPSPIHNETP